MSKRKPIICGLTGLEIPEGEFSIDHYVAKYWLPSNIANLPQNKIPAMKIINTVKGIMFPCEWAENRYYACYNAALNWKLKPKQLAILSNAVILFKDMPIENPCTKCILRQDKYKALCEENEKLAKYRAKWKEKEK